MAKKLANQTFKIPLGISIGKTNTKHKETQKAAIADILQAFKVFESSNIKNLPAGRQVFYYELSISCPNLYGNITFYDQKNLDELPKLLKDDGYKTISEAIGSEN